MNFLSKFTAQKNETIFRNNFVEFDKSLTKDSREFDEREQFEMQPHFSINQDEGICLSGVQKTPNNRMAYINNNSTTCMSSRTGGNTPIVYMAIVEGRGHARGEVGVASMSINSPILKLKQFSDNFWYNGLLTEINILTPKEIIVPHTLLNGNPVPRIIETIQRNQLLQTNLKSLSRRHFNSSDGINLINKLCCQKYDNIKLIITKKYYALLAASALLKYFEYFLKISFADFTLKIEYVNQFGSMLIDIETARKLELVNTTASSTDKTSNLFGLLNKSRTIIGKLNLRANILQPSCNFNHITQIQECVKELLSKTKVLIQLENCLSSFYYVDQLLKISIIIREESIVKSTETFINQIFLLKNCLQNIPKLSNVLDEIRSNYVTLLNEKLQDERYTSLLTTINTIVENNIQYFRGKSPINHQLYAVQRNINCKLDISRDVYGELIDEMRDLINKLSAEHNQPFRMMHTKNRGYHIQLKCKTLPKLPVELQLISQVRNVYSFTTNDITKLNYRLDNVLTQILTESNGELVQLMAKIRCDMDCMYNLVGVISNLDLLQCLTNFSSDANFCCPEFATDIRIINGIHPMLQYNKSKIEPVPNNVIATPEYNFFIITGPNMGGKTIYLKMIAILQILAQLGSFVPAESAQFRMCDKLFSRIGFDDNLEQNVSSFVLEVKEMEYIYCNITPGSLVIIDELCRSTNPVEAEYIAYRMCEKMLKLNGIYSVVDNVNVDIPSHVIRRRTDKNLVTRKIQDVTMPYIYVTTHFPGLCKLSNKYLNVNNLYLHADENLINDVHHINFTYKIKLGVMSFNGYSIALAKSISFPVSVIQRAEEIFKTLQISNINNNNNNDLNSNQNSVSNFINRTCDSVISRTLLSVDDSQTQMETNKNDNIQKNLYEFNSQLMRLIREQTKGKSNEELQIELNSYFEDFLTNSVNNEYMREILNRNSNSNTTGNTSDLSKLSNYSRLGRLNRMYDSSIIKRTTHNTTNESIRNRMQKIREGSLNNSITTMSSIFTDNKNSSRTLPKMTYFDSTSRQEINETNNSIMTESISTENKGMNRISSFKSIPAKDNLVKQNNWTFSNHLTTNELIENPRKNMKTHFNASTTTSISSTYENNENFHRKLPKVTYFDNSSIQGNNQSDQHRTYFSDVTSKNSMQQLNSKRNYKTQFNRNNNASIYDSRPKTKQISDTIIDRTVISCQNQNRYQQTPVIHSSARYLPVPSYYDRNSRAGSTSSDNHSDGVSGHNTKNQYKLSLTDSSVTRSLPIVSHKKSALHVIKCKLYSSYTLKTTKSNDILRNKLKKFHYNRHKFHQQTSIRRTRISRGYTNKKIKDKNGQYKFKYDTSSTAERCKFTHFDNHSSFKTSTEPT